MLTEPPQSPAAPAGWKRLALRSAGAGAGFAVAASLIITGFLWYESRPKAPVPWNTNAIKATFSRGVDLSAGLVPKVDTNELSFTFIIENSTDSDFRLSDSSTNSILVRLKQEKALSSYYAVGLNPFWNREQQAYVTRPVFLPAKQRATVDLYVSCYFCTEDFDGFVLFDETNHYEINFNLPPDWEKK